jgi:hypothetical protein
MVNRFKFDYTTFQAELIAHARTVFTALREKYTPETLYLYGLEAHAEFERIFPFVSTEKDQDISLHELFIDRDFELNNLLEELHEMVAKGMSSLDGMISSAQQELPQAEVELRQQSEEARYRQACIEALQALDRTGFFGRQVPRSEVQIYLVFYGYAEPDRRCTLIGPLEE